MASVYVIASGKGGTGKTSVTAGVGASLARLGHKTLCIDTDIGLRNLDIVLGMSDTVMMSFADVIEKRCTLHRAAVENSDIKGLFLLTAPMMWEKRTIPIDGMTALVEEARESYDYILIDAPAGLGSGFQLAVSGADRALIVTTTDSASLRDAQRTVMELGDYPLQGRHLVVNRVEKRLMRRLHCTIDDAIDTAGAPLIGVVPEDPQVRIATNQETPVVLTQRNGAVKAYENIARRICGERVSLMRI